MHCYEEMDCDEVANSQIIMCQGNTLHDQYMYLPGDLFREGIGKHYVDLNLSNHFCTAIAGPRDTSQSIC